MQSMHPRQRKTAIFVGNLGDLDDGSRYLGSFSLCFQDDE